MKLQIDTEAKTVKVEGQVNLKDFTEKIKVILPDWEEYKLETNTVIHNWSNPIYIPYAQPYYPWSPFHGPWTFGVSPTTMQCVYTAGPSQTTTNYNFVNPSTLTAGVYNLELN